MLFFIGWLYLTVLLSFTEITTKMFFTADVVHVLKHKFTVVIFAAKKTQKGAMIL